MKRQTYKRCFYAFLLVITCSSVANAQWKQMSVGNGGPPPATGDWMTCLSVGSGTNVFVASNVDTAGLFKSSDNGVSWSAFGKGLRMPAQALLFRSGRMIAGGGSPFGSSVGSVYISEDEGATWRPCKKPYYGFLLCMAFNGSDVLAGTADMGLIRSKDNGESWDEVGGNGYPVGAQVMKILGLGNTIIIAVGGNNEEGVFVSKDNGASWKRTSKEIVTEFGFVGGKVFAGALESTLISEDSGSTWNDVTNEIGKQNVQGMEAYGPNLFAFTARKVYLTSDEGKHWTEVGDSLPTANDFIISDMKVSGNNLLLATSQKVWMRPLSQMVTLIPNGIGDLVNQTSIHLYPNPNEGKFMIQRELLGDEAELSVSNGLGQIVFRGRLEKGADQLTVELQNRTPGVYFLQVTSNAGNAVQKFVIQ